jgi:hypothetical protein
VAKITDALSPASHQFWLHEANPCKSGGNEGLCLKRAIFLHRFCFFYHQTVPEPSNVAILGVGILSLIGLRKTSL